MEDRFGFPKCVGVIDGTLLPLEFRPTLFGENYFTRKGSYAVQMLIISDPHSRIMYYNAGGPGSVHDNRVWVTCVIGREPEKFFSRSEYVLGDSAFSSCLHLVSCFKASAGQTLEANKEAFNILVARPRVRSEHCIGVMKGRFPWMRKIRILIKSKEDMEVILSYVKAVVILHNLCIGSYSDPNWICNEDEDIYVDEDLEEVAARAEASNDMRASLMDLFSRKSAETGIF